jgi:gluconolactonase
MVGAPNALSPAQTPAPRTGPGVQAAQDAREPQVLAGCKTPPAPGRGRGRGPGTNPANAGPAGPGSSYAIKEIPGVIRAAEKWTEIMPVEGNNADGIIATDDGGILSARNDMSDVVKVDRKGKVSVVYSGTNTGGSLAISSKGVLLLANRGLNPSIVELAPEKKTLADKYQGDQLDCIGGVLNDIAADSKGGVYFTMNGLLYADPKGVVTRYGQNLATNGIILSADEKTLYVTNAGTLAAFDVQKDGSLTNQREFTRWEGGGGDGSTFDAAGRLYVTTPAGVQVVGTDGRILGVIPAPRNLISLAFSGPDRKTLFAVARDGARNQDWLLSIRMIAQGPRGRGK